MKTKNILFDMGGVLLDIDYHKTRDAFIRLGVTNFDDFYSQTYASPLFAELEKGNISAEEFYAALRQLTGYAIDTPLIQVAWNAMLLGFRKESLLFAEQLKQQYNVFLLSNTNVIHYDALLQLHTLQFGNSRFDEHFTKAYYSHLLHQRKPDAAAFEAVLQQSNLVATETLFVDDTFKNLLPAQQLGLQTLYLQPGELIEEKMRWML